MNSLVAEVEKMKNTDYYVVWPDKLIKAAEVYHIEKIAEKYRALK